MGNIIEKIQKRIFELKERMFLHKIKKHTGQIYSDKHTKNVITKGASLTINSKTTQTIAEVKDNVTAIVNKTNAEPAALLEYIKAAKTPVFRIKNAKKLLALIMEEEGLIYCKDGFEALYLSVITGQGIKFNTEPMFILPEEVPEKYWLLHNFYRWYSLKSELPGFDIATQKLFKQYLIDNSDKATKRLTMGEVLSLQEAIARDQEATAFVLEYTNKIDGGKNVLDKIKKEGNASI